jgi:hypothetical protein
MARVVVGSAKDAPVCRVVSHFGLSAKHAKGRQRKERKGFAFFFLSEFRPPERNVPVRAGVLSGRLPAGRKYAKKKNTRKILSLNIFSLSVLNSLPPWRASRLSADTGRDKP